MGILEMNENLDNYVDTVAENLDSFIEAVIEKGEIVQCIVDLSSFYNRRRDDEEWGERTSLYRRLTHFDYMCMVKEIKYTYEASEHMHVFDTAVEPADVMLSCAHFPRYEFNKSPAYAPHYRADVDEILLQYYDEFVHFLPSRLYDFYERLESKHLLARMVRPVFGNLHTIFKIKVSKEVYDIIQPSLNGYVKDYTYGKPITNSLLI